MQNPTVELSPEAHRAPRRTVRMRHLLVCARRMDIKSASASSSAAGSSRASRRRAKTQLPWSSASARAADSYPFIFLSGGEAAVRSFATRGESLARAAQFCNLRARPERRRAQPEAARR